MKNLILSLILAGALWSALAARALAQEPLVTVITSTLETGNGFVFTAPINSGQLVIMDNMGRTVFTRPGIQAPFDFKCQGDMLTYFTRATDQFEVLNRDYQLIDTWTAVGYLTDPHDLQLLGNGHALLLIYHYFPVDMSLIVPGGSPTATVASCVIQELDQNKNVSWEWNSWDHIPISDTNRSLTASLIDYVHCNAVEQDDDGNILLSGRHLDEVTKINRQTGQIIWRMGGKANQFTFTNDDGFALQHDIRRLADGHITLFDNGVAARGYSRAVEYELDEVNKVITRTWEYRGPFASCCGNAQRLPNGNTFINWGPARMMTEVKPDGSVVFAAEINATFSYRSFRFAWQLRHWLPIILK
jgi:hypothetical protein